MIPEFLAELTKHYSTHHLAPSLVLSSITVKGEPKWYAAVHVFPNGLNSRHVMCKHTADSYDVCVETLVTIWRSMHAVRNERESQS